MCLDTDVDGSLEVNQLFNLFFQCEPFPANFTHSAAKKVSKLIPYICCQSGIPVKTMVCV